MICTMQAPIFDGVDKITGAEAKLIVEQLMQHINKLISVKDAVIKTLTENINSLEESVEKLESQKDDPEAARKTT